MEASNADGLERSSEGGVARLALAKPPRNLLDPDVMTALREAILEADADGDVQAIVLTGAGEMFCGGLDIERIQAGEDPVAFASALVELLRGPPDPRQAGHRRRQRRRAGVGLRARCARRTSR